MSWRLLANKWNEIKHKIDELPAGEAAKVRERSRREMAADAYERQLGEVLGERQRPADDEVPAAV